MIRCRVMALDTVVEVAREASTEATGELVTRAHFDTALAQLESRLAWAPGHGRDRDPGRGRRGAAVPWLTWSSARTRPFGSELDDDASAETLRMRGKRDSKS